MKNNIVRHGILFWNLCKTDMLILRHEAVEKIINIIVWIGGLIIATAYALPAFGLSQDYGAFIAYSAILGEGYWRIWTAASNLISDLEGNKEINYYVTLPAPSWLFFLKEAVMHAVKSTFFCIVTFALCKLILGTKMGFAHFSLPKFCLIFIVSSFFIGAFYLLLASFTKSVASSDSIGVRILFPLWFLGAAEFPWSIMKQTLSPAIAYAALANPVLYGMEGIHAAALGQNGYLNFWLCVAVVLICSIVTGYVAIRRFMKRLDLV